MSDQELKPKSRKNAERETALVKIIQTWDVWLVVSVYR